MGEERCKQCICLELKQLLEEQERLSLKGFRFVCESIGYDTIPFILSNGQSQLEAFGRLPEGQLFFTPAFKLETLDTERCCAILSLLAPIDMDGKLVDFCEEVFSLLTTNTCIAVDLSCFCSIQPLSPKLVNRALPIVEHKW